VSYSSDRERFVEYLWAKKLSKGYTKILLSNLNRHFSAAKIEKPMDIHLLFGKLTVGQSNNLAKALGSYLDFLELDGQDKLYIDSLRNALPS
jgi:hypothetical protein